MKVILIFVLATAALCSALPKDISEQYSHIPGDNSHYVEGVSRYIWMPDGEGKPHLVDLHAKVDENAMPTKNGADNQYWLYTRRNRNSAQILRVNDANSVWNSNFDGSRPVKVIVHGWNNNGNSPMNPMITEAFLAVSDVNVIVVDWNRLANNALYPWVATQVPDVGRHLGNFLVWLLNTAGGNWNNVHLIGFSLGAHVVGSAGRTIGNNRVGRVTGLDPAGPTFGGNSQALKTSDGRYVEAIHTDGGLLGIFDPIADANFYPNGGRNPQPGCFISTCSHGRAPELFAATVHHNHLIGRQCSSISQAQQNNCSGGQLAMGNAILNKSGNGLFGLSTGRSWPF